MSADGRRAPDHPGARVALDACAIVGARAADVELGEGSRVQLVNTEASNKKGQGTLERAEKLDESWRTDANAADKRP